MSEENQEKQENQSNSLWGTGFTRIASWIFLGAILLMAGRYIYLKMTGQYSSSYEQQDIIQYPHLDELEKQRQQKSIPDTNAKDTLR